MTKDHSNSDKDVDRPSSGKHSSNILLHIQHNWSPPMEAEILAEPNLSVPEIVKKNKYKYPFKSMLLLVAVLGLISLGLCIQADAITQFLREVTRMSVKAVIFND